MKQNRSNLTPLACSFEMTNKLLLILLMAIVSSAAWAWERQEDVDRMRGTKTSFTYTISLNKADFPFPYNGGSTLELNIRNRKQDGISVALIIKKGQFTCHDECSIHAKFDDEKIERFGTTRSSSGKPDLIFISPNGRFIAKLKQSKKLTVEADFYKVGSEQFQFDVAGLQLD